MTVYVATGHTFAKQNKKRKKQTTNAQTMTALMMINFDLNVCQYYNYRSGLFFINVGLGYL